MGEQMFTMKSEVVSQLSIMSEDPVQSVDQIIYEKRHFTISEHPCEFPHCMHCSLQNYQLGWAIITRFPKIGSKNVHERAQNAENSFGFGFFRVIPQR
jgi:hypothetical protein